MFLHDGKRIDGHGVHYYDDESDIMIAGRELRGHGWYGGGDAQSVSFQNEREKFLFSLVPLLALIALCLYLIIACSSRGGCFCSDDDEQNNKTQQHQPNKKDGLLTSIASSDDDRQDPTTTAYAGSSSAHITHLLPKSGVYETIWYVNKLSSSTEEPPQRLLGQIHLSFRRTRGGWEITGGGTGVGGKFTSSSSSGRFTVTNGHVSCSGQALWTEEFVPDSIVFSSRSKTMASCVGVFDFATNSFSGHRQLRKGSNSGTFGAYELRF